MHESIMVLLACKAGESVSTLDTETRKRDSTYAHEILMPSPILDMEDAHTTIPEYKNTGASFFAVFDGHGGMYYYLFIYVYTA